MKHKTNQLLLNAALVTDGAGAVELAGLRPCESHDGTMVLRPAPVSAAVTLPQGWNALAKIDNQLIIINGTSVATFVDDVARVADIALPGAMRSHVPVGDRLLLMCDNGAAFVGVDGGVPVVTPARRDYPAITLYGVDDVEVSAHVDSRKLSKSYTSGLFDKKDHDALVGDLAGAYRRICADAAASGLMVQPALARYRLLDAVGRVLFESAPVLVCHSTGAQCTDTMALTSPERLSVNPYVLQASTWHLEAALPSMPDSGVAQAEVLMTPLFHPYDTSLPGNTYLGSASSPSTVFARVGLPGRERGLGTVYRDNARRIIMQAIARIEMLEERVAVIADPFGGTPRSVAVSVAVNPDPAVDMAKIISAFAKPVVPRTYAQVMLDKPHTFSADSAASASGAVAWGGLHVGRYEGYHLPAFAAAVGNGEWRSVCAVNFDGGEGVVRSDEGSAMAPSRLGPVLCYPAPDAREMTVVAWHGGANHKQTFALTTDASGRFAVYVDPDMKPFSLPLCDPTVAVTATPGVIDFPDMIAFGPVARPLEIVATTTVGNSIVAMAGHRGSDQAWDFGRARFTVACRDAVYNAGVNLATRKTGLRTVLTRGIDRPDAMTSGPGGEVYIADGDGVVVLSRGGGLRRLAAAHKYVALGYDEVGDEVWALRDDGSVDIFCRRYGFGRYSRTDLAPDGFVNLGGLYFVAGRKLYDVNGDDGQSRHVRMCLRSVPRLRYGPLRPVDLVFTAQASQINAGLAVNASGVAGLRPCLLRSMAVDGVLAGPVRVPLPRRIARAVDICLEGIVSGDFVFDSFTFSYE